eukprot:scaffold191879_cov32-Tisochrysis_lutea.AAC.2
MEAGSGTVSACSACCPGKGWEGSLRCWCLHLCIACCPSMLGLSEPRAHQPQRRQRVGACACCRRHSARNDLALPALSSSPRSMLGAEQFWLLAP